MKQQNIKYLLNYVNGNGIFVYYRSLHDVKAIDLGNVVTECMHFVYFIIPLYMYKFSVKYSSFCG